MQVVCETHCLTDYLNFCVDMVVPTKTVRCYPNNKPWITQKVKDVLNRKKKAFKTKDKEEMKDAQREVKRCLKEAKESYRRKVQKKLGENSMQDVWDGVKTNTGHKAKTSTEGGGVERANDLNHFFNRFSRPTSHHPPCSSSAASFLLLDSPPLPFPPLHLPSSRGPLYPSSLHAPSSSSSFHPSFRNLKNARSR